MELAVDPRVEWLEADGLGGYASGTVCGIRTRRYHALLLTATRPPTGRIVLVNGFDAWVRTAAGTYALSSHDYSPGVTHPDGAQRIVSFESEPWPSWRYRLEDGTEIEQEVFVPTGHSLVVVRWRLSKRPKRRKAARTDEVALTARLLFSGRDYHALHRENGGFNFEPERHQAATDLSLIWRPYAGLPSITVSSNGTYEHQPDWYRNFLYEQERARGLDCIEDLATPGLLRWDVHEGDAVLFLAAGTSGSESSVPEPLLGRYETMRKAELGRRKGVGSVLQRAADAYLVRRGDGRTIVAGYPWFTDWGRDTFVALRGLCLTTGRLEDAKRILLQWAGFVSEGMLPNRFPDEGDAPEYNSVDASLWYIIAVHDVLRVARSRRVSVTRDEADTLHATVEAILTGYARGTRYGIRMDQDGLLAAGQPGVALTWMDARIDQRAVTPRIGKPVEVQALWLNALRAAGERSTRWNDILARGQDSFEKRFWCEDGYLYDVVDCDHEPGTVDPTFRPNQIFVLGGLPTALLDAERARAVLEAVEARLLTPLGLRSLAPGEAGYHPSYRGTVTERDQAYHQGVVWPWLLGAFVEAWLRVRGRSAATLAEARTRFLPPLTAHLREAGLGHISEITDGEPPYTPGGCPFQAWSVGEALRVQALLTAPTRARTPKAAPSRGATTKRKQTRRRGA